MQVQAEVQEYKITDSNLYFGDELIGRLYPVPKVKIGTCIEIVNELYKDNPVVYELFKNKQYNQFVQYVKQQIDETRDKLKAQNAKSGKLISTVITAAIKYIPVLAIYVCLTANKSDKQEITKYQYTIAIDFLNKTCPELATLLINSIRTTIRNSNFILDTLVKMLSINEYDDIIHIINDCVYSAMTDRRILNQNQVGIQLVKAIVKRSISLLVLRKVKYDVQYNTPNTQHASSDIRDIILSKLVQRKISNIKIDKSAYEFIRFGDNFVYRLFVVPLLTLDTHNDKPFLLQTDDMRKMLTYYVLQNIEDANIRKLMFDIVKNAPKLVFTSLSHFPSTDNADDENIYITIKYTAGFPCVIASYKQTRSEFDIQKTRKAIKSIHEPLAKLMVQSYLIEKQVMIMYAVFSLYLKHNFSLLPKQDIQALYRYICNIYYKLFRMQYSLKSDTKLLV